MNMPLGPIHSDRISRFLIDWTSSPCRVPPVLLLRLSHSSNLYRGTFLCGNHSQQLLHSSLCSSRSQLVSWLKRNRQANRRWLTIGRCVSSSVRRTHPGLRANHPKGVVLEGVFTLSAAAPSVSKAAHLQPHKKPIPVTVRFSAGSGLPTVSDKEEMPRGMAVKFHVAGWNTDGHGGSIVQRLPSRNSRRVQGLSVGGRRKRTRRAQAHSHRNILGSTSGCKGIRRGAETTTD